MTHPRILLVTHGHKHPRSNPGYRFLSKNPWCFKRAVCIDIDAGSNPNHVMDVMENNIDALEERFDYIFCMYTPCYVLRSKQFWYNVEAWLAPGGIVQTILPIYVRTREFPFARRISTRTGLQIMPKSAYMSRDVKAIVLRKDKKS